MNLSEPDFLTIENATVKHLGKVIFQGLNFEMLEGQSWAILAGSGTEKTAFLDTILGKTVLSEGKIRRKFAMEYRSEKTRQGEINSFRDLIATVSQRYEFRNKFNMQDFYYQQRFNSSDSEEAATVGEYLGSIEVKAAGEWDLEKVLDLLHLSALKDKSLIKLSNGETRRLAIGGALMKNPRLLLMDRPMTGLDVDTRREFAKILKAITRSGIQVVMTTRPTEIPEAVTHVGVLDQGRLAKAVERSTFQLSDFEEYAEEKKSFSVLKTLVKEIDIPTYKHLIRMKDVHIQYGEKVILDKINWEVKQGERWALKGHNGAGKSTLLSLIFGENPQAYANNIVLFDRQRGTGESLWDIKRPTGFVSAEISRYFPKSQTCLQVVLSGIFDTIGLFRKVAGEQESAAREWLEAFGIGHVSSLRLGQASLEAQRFCLLARAMIKSPALLILDEASQGMDERQRDVFRDAVDVVCLNSNMSLIYVSHYEEDIPHSVNKRMVLHDGRIVESKSI